MQASVINNILPFCNDTEPLPPSSPFLSLLSSPDFSPFICSLPILLTYPLLILSIYSYLCLFQPLSSGHFLYPIFLCWMSLSFCRRYTLHYITLLCLVPGLQQPGPARQYTLYRVLWVVLSTDLHFYPRDALHARSLPSCGICPSVYQPLLCLNS